MNAASSYCPTAPTTMAQLGYVETPVTGEKGWFAETAQQDDDLRVLASRSAHVQSDLTRAYLPPFQGSTAARRGYFHQERSRAQGLWYVRRNNVPA
jgi:hypothetical protein